jgi:hypothetical protein
LVSEGEGQAGKITAPAALVKEGQAPVIEKWLISISLAQLIVTILKLQIICRIWEIQKSIGHRVILRIEVGSVPFNGSFLSNVANNRFSALLNDMV